MHWAHHIAERFPDGQLYVNLRGFDPSGSAMPPDEAIRGFLDAFGTPPTRIPTGFDAQVGLYRSLLARRRVLVVLDNARDSEQVRSLLPAAPGCLAVVTSRNQLDSLVATDGARPLTLELLTAVEARQLLANRLGRHRVAAEPDAVDEIIAWCAGLPLAVAIVAARAATHPTFPLGALAEELRAARGNLDAFSVADAATDVRAVFSWSYHTLSTDAARLFRLLGLHPGPELATPAAASLAGLPTGQVRPLLAELTRTNLLTEPSPGRYTRHDLLRTYATELNHSHDAPADRAAALRRMLDHYLHTAHAAAVLFEPHRDPIALGAPAPGASYTELTDHRQALAWFSTERPVLLAAIELAAEHGLDTHAWQLAWTLVTFLKRRGQWSDLAASQRTALAAAGRLADRSGQANAHRWLARAYTRIGRADDAHGHLEHALGLFGELGDKAGQAHVHYDLTWVFDGQGNHEAARDHAREALELYVAAGHRVGEANALNTLGWYQALLGDHQQALTHCSRALALLQDLGDRFGVASTWDSLGYAHHNLGDHEQAARCFRNAIDMFRDIGHPDHEADTSIRLGDVHRDAGDLDAARAAWTNALRMLDELGHPDADRVRAKLQGLTAG